MKKVLALSVLTLGMLASKANATVALQFVNAGFISNLANAAGVPTDGMQWGVVISTANAGFSGSGAAYNSIASITNEGFLQVSGVATDDYYIPGGLTQDSSLASEVGGLNASGAPGTLADDMVDIALTGDASGLGLGAGITSGDIFGILWFSTNSGSVGAKYGFFTDPSFVIPGNGGAVDYSAGFLGADPIRAAANTFQAAGVPEPSRVLLFAFGGLGLLMRRRRA